MGKETRFDLLPMFLLFLLRESYAADRRKDRASLGTLAISLQSARVVAANRKEPVAESARISGSWTDLAFAA